ncbi:MAG: DUF1080 domain-containing protein [Planctomycetaceae bacterium]|nr:MAG: DUF1080 domain-containing protein [Planctomycetaceae bacterium]
MFRTALNRCPNRCLSNPFGRDTSTSIVTGGLGRPLIVIVLLCGGVGTLPRLGTAGDPPTGAIADPLTATAKATAAAESDAGFVPLFDSRTLQGWEGKEVWFRIEEGAIVAGSLEKPIPHNQFLCTTRDFDNFELRMQVKTRGKGANGGIQFRSRRVPDSDEVEGYQADVGGVSDRWVWGGLYDESRRRRFLAEPTAEQIEKLVRPDDWNDYVIRCVGPRIELFINGVRTVDYTESDPEIPRSGLIGLQIHSGPPCEVLYRNLRIRTL